MKPKFVMFCGSSAVGKTQLVESFPMFATLDIQPSFRNVMPFNRITMNFRDIREQLGNPSWDDLLHNSKLAERQQTFGMEVYEERLSSLVNTARPNTTYIMERCPFDIVGYSHSFGLSTKFQDGQIATARALLNDLREIGELYIIFRPVDEDLPYAIEAARPPVQIRKDCNERLTDLMEHFSIRNHYHIRKSVNHGEQELHEILEYIF